MSTQTLGSVASLIVGQYGQVGTLLLSTYRTGAQRLVNGANTRYAAFVNSRYVPLLNEAAKARLIKVQRQIAGLVEGGVTSSSDRAAQAIALLAGGVDSGIHRVAATVERVENAFHIKAITTVGNLTVPVAQVSLDIANLAVEGTKRLSATVVDAEAEVVKPAAGTKRVVKKAARRVRARA